MICYQNELYYLYTIGKNTLSSQYILYLAIKTIDGVIHKTLKISVIDLGFNSLKLVNYYVNTDNSYKAYEQQGIRVRLGANLRETGLLSRESINSTINALKLFRDKINFQSINYVVAVATSAVREAD